MKLALDANCFIDATKPASSAFHAMGRILAARERHVLELAVGLHAVSELKRKPDAALDLALSCAVLPHFPIGSRDDQVASWKELAGTWDDARRNDVIQQELKALAKAGNDIRDRGAYIDALAAAIDVFVTSDLQLVGKAPAKRIEERFGLRILSPDQLAAEMDL